MGKGASLSKPVRVSTPPHWEGAGIQASLDPRKQFPGNPGAQWRCKKTHGFSSRGLVHGLMLAGVLLLFGEGGAL